MASIFCDAVWRKGTPGGAAYYKKAALSQSLLKYVDRPEDFLAVWNALKKKMPSPIKVTPSMLEGSLLDDLLFNPRAKWEPQRGRDGNTKPKGVNWLPGYATGAWAGVHKAAEAVKAHPAYSLVQPHPNNLHQCEIYCTHAGTGLPFKMRLDTLKWWDRKQVIDVKKTADIDPEGFAKQCAALGRYDQAAAYLEGCHALGGEWEEVKDFTCVAVALPEGGELPPRVRVYTLLRTDCPEMPGSGSTDSDWEQYHAERECFEAYPKAVAALEEKIYKAERLIRKGLPPTVYSFNPCPPPKWAYK